MIEFTAKAVKILGFSIYYYGIILMFATVAGILLAKGEAKRKNKNVDFLYDSIPWLMFGGIVGARLWHIFTPPPSMVAQGITTKFYLTHPLDALNIRAGGLGIPGAVVGGLLIFYWFAKRRNEVFSDWLDIFAPAIPLGQAIGRWGNFVNQELYGAPSDLPWATISCDSAPVAQPDRATGFEPVGRGFESLRARQIFQEVRVSLNCFVSRLTTILTTVCF